MMPEVVGNLLIVLGIPVLIARIIVIIAYNEWTWRLFLTGVLPTFAVLVLLIRVAIQRNFEGLISPQDWIAVATWAFIVATQFVATGVQYFPAKLFRRRGARG